jgi:hypothetical protein
MNLSRFWKFLDVGQALQKKERNFYIQILTLHIGVKLHNKTDVCQLGKNRYKPNQNDPSY